MSNDNSIAANDLKCLVYSALFSFRPKYKENYINKGKEHFLVVGSRDEAMELHKTAMEMRRERLKTITKQCQGGKIILNSRKTQSMFWELGRNPATYTKV